MSNEEEYERLLLELASIGLELEETEEAVREWTSNEDMSSNRQSRNLSNIPVFKGKDRVPGLDMNGDTTKHEGKRLSPDVNSFYGKSRFGVKGRISQSHSNLTRKTSNTRTFRQPSKEILYQTNAKSDSSLTIKNEVSDRKENKSNLYLVNNLRNYHKIRQRPSSLDVDIRGVTSAKENRNGNCLGMYTSQRAGKGEHKTSRQVNGSAPELLSLAGGEQLKPRTSVISMRGIPADITLSTSALPDQPQPCEVEGAPLHGEESLVVITPGSTSRAPLSSSLKENGISPQDEQIKGREVWVLSEQIGPAHPGGYRGGRAAHGDLDGSLEDVWVPRDDLCSSPTMELPDAMREHGMKYDAIYSDERNDNFEQVMS